MPAQSERFEPRVLRVADPHLGHGIRRQLEPPGLTSGPLHHQRQHVVLGALPAPPHPLDGLGELHRPGIAHHRPVVLPVAGVADELPVPHPRTTRHAGLSRREDGQQQADLPTVPGQPQVLDQHLEQAALVAAADTDFAAVPDLQPLPVELADALRVVAPGDPGALQELLVALPVAARGGQFGRDLPGPLLSGLGREVPFRDELSQQVGGLSGHRTDGLGGGYGLCCAQVRGLHDDPLVNGER